MPLFLQIIRLLFLQRLIITSTILKLTDAESGETVDLLADREALESYRKALEAFLRDVRETCFRRETPHVLLDSGKDFEEQWIPLVSAAGII